MDSYGFTDNIQSEKANAVARYNRFTNVSKLLTAIEVLIAVALISWSSVHIPTVFKLSGEFLYACSCYVMNRRCVVFLVGNVIVVVCYVLSGHSDVGSDSNCSNVLEHNRFRSETNRNTSESDSSIESSPTPVEVSPEVKPTAVAVVEVEDEIVRSEKTSEIDAETVIKQAVREIERFRRTQSAKLSTEMSVRNRRELRRSVTERRRSAVVAGTGDVESAATATVERLSNEEFRLAVEAFISKQQSFLKKQTVGKTYYL